MKKFRFLLLHQWIIVNFEPCRVADIGGGKGMLSYLLNKDGFESFVIDPVEQDLPKKYKDLSGKKIVIPADTKITRINSEFEIEMAKNFNLLIGLHAHGSNMKIIDACAKYDKNFILLPCCVVDEPIIPKPNIDWFESLEEYTNEAGLETKRFELNFKGQNKGFYRVSKD